MQKKYFLLLCAFLIGIGIVMAEINPDLQYVDDGLGYSDTVDPLTTIESFIKNLLTLLSLLFMVLPLYILPALGTDFLRKKYAPHIRRFWCWIPGTFVYPLTKVAGLSGWWSFSFLIPLLYIYVYVQLAEKLKRGAGTIMGLFFLPHIFIPYLGYKEAKKPMGTLWILVLLPVISLIAIFFIWTVTSLVFDILSGDTISA